MKILAFLMPMACLLALPAAAHQVLLDTWLDGPDLLVKVSFGDNAVAQDAKVTLFLGEETTPVFDGTTNASGECRIAVTEQMRDSADGLRIVANAGMGHRSERRLQAQALSEPALLAAAALAAPSHEHDHDHNHDRGRNHDHDHDHDYGHEDDHEHSHSHIADGVTAEAIEQIVRQELYSLKQDVAALKNRRPGATEIVGGIGYIIGLAGLVAYFSARKHGA